jgi:GTP cyclohydrolase I
MNRKRVAASLATLLFLVGCDSNQDNLTTTDKAYISTLREEITGVKDMSDGKLIALGREACASSDNGDDFFKTVDKVSNYGLTESDSAYLIGTAFAAYCPNNVSKIGG